MSDPDSDHFNIEATLKDNPDGTHTFTIEHPASKLRITIDMAGEVGELEGEVLVTVLEALPGIISKLLLTRMLEDKITTALKYRQSRLN